MIASLPLAPGSAGSGTGTGARATVAEQPPVLTSRQAHGISIVVQFLDAFNARNFKRALGSFATDPRYERYVAVSDCDYRNHRSVSFRGRRSVAAWLRQRFADRDRLTVRSVRLLTTDPPSTYDKGAAVEYTRRTSETLRALGFPNGIQPQLATKIPLTWQGPVRIVVFANAGNDSACRPAPAP